MFTGIITAIGHIVDVTSLGDSAQFGKRLTISTPHGYLSDTQPGDSIAINGACMTVTTLNASQAQFTVDISAESLDKTAGLGGKRRVNLEKALRANDRLGGHIVSGHVDGVGSVSRLVRVGESWELCVICPAHLAPFLAIKGSATINGVSLTTNQVTDTTDGCEISINLIPHTLEHTSLGDLAAGHHVNIEIDLMARYVERMLSKKPLIPGTAA